MSGAYDDMMHLAYPRPTGRRRMTMLQRAAQFSPFAALSGYDDALRETARLTRQPVELAEDGAALLDEKLRRVVRRIGQRPMVSILCFQPDSRKSGGAYVRVTGRLKRYDSCAGVLLLEQGTAIPVSEILDIREEPEP